MCDVMTRQGVLLASSCSRAALVESNEPRRACDVATCTVLFRVFLLLVSPAAIIPREL
jgi:hypothetical protein